MLDKRKKTINANSELYNVERWSNGYFAVNEKGHLCVLPEKRPDGPTIDIMEVIEEIKSQDIPFPTVIRFHDILRSQVRLLNLTFREAMEESGYQGRFIGVYPIKVNQTREVVEEIIEAGEPFDYGLEAGSKSELMAALTLNDNRNALTVLNGYKDEEYIRLALLGRKLDRKIIIVVENFSEICDDHPAGRGDERHAADRHAGQTVGAGRGPLGRFQRRPGEIRADLQRDPKRRLPAASGTT